MNKISSEMLKKSLTNVVAVIVALSLVFLQWPISGLSQKASADAVDGVQERLSKTTSIDVPLSFEHAYITYADQVIAEPATKVTIPSGADLVFTATPDSGYQIESVTAKIDGKDTKLSLNKEKKYKLTASEVALTDKIKVRAITAPTVEDETVEVASSDASPAEEPVVAEGESASQAEPAGEGSAPAESAQVAAGSGAGEQAASGTDENAAADAAAEPAEPVAAETAAAPASESSSAYTTLDLSSLDTMQLESQSSSSAASLLSTSLSVASSSVTPITDGNATVEIAIYPSESDRTNRTNALTSDYEISVAETLYGAVHFDFNPGEGPKTGRLTYSYTMPDNIKTEDKPVATLYDDAGNRAGTWEISGGTVYFYYDESWALAHPNGGGNFDFDFTLDEETTETGGESTFSFPGATNTISVKVKDAEITGTKANAGVEEGGYVSYTVKLHAQKDFSTFIFSDHLEKNLSYVEGSFELDGVPFEVSITSNADGTHDAAAQARSISAGDHVVTYRTKLDQSAYDAMKNWETLANTRNTAKWDYGNDGELKHGSADSWLWLQKNILNKWQSGGLWQGNMVKWTVQVNGSDQFKTDIAGYTVTDTLQPGMTYWNHFNVVDSNWHVIKEVPIPDGATSFTYTFPDDAGSNTYYIEYYTIIQDIDAISQSTTFGNDAKITPPDGGDPTESKSTYTYNPSSGTGDGSGDNTPQPDVTKEVIDQSKALSTGVVSWHSTLVSDIYPEPEQTSGLVLQYFDSLQNWNNQGDITQGSSRYYKIWFTGEPQLYANGVKLVKGVDYQFDEQGGRTYGYVAYGQNFEGEDVPVAYRIRFILDTPLMSDVVANKTPIDIYYDTECDGTFQTYYNEGRARITSGNTEIYGKSVQATHDLQGESRVSKSGWIWFDEQRGKYVVQWEIVANRTDSWDCVTPLPSPLITITDTLPDGMKVIEDTIDLYVVRPGNHGLQYIATNPEYTFNQKGNVATVTTDLTKAKLESWQEPFYNEETGECYAWAQLRFQTELDPAYVVHGDDAQTLRNTATAKAGSLPLGTGQAAVSYTDSVISKTGYQNDGEPVVHYTIKVNEKAEKLDPDATHTQINLTDTLDYRSTVVPSSIKVMEGDADITSQCAITLGNGSQDETGIDTSAFTIQVPDGKSLVITYDVKLSGVENQWYEVTNSATLNGITSKQTNSKQWFKVNHADASVYGSNTSISITKMDSGNILADSGLLAGAVFELYSVDMGKLPDGPWTDDGLKAASALVNTVSTDEAGSAVLFDEATKAIQYDTLYYFKEVQAPAGYAIDDPSPHFVMTQGSDFYAQNARAESHGIHASPNTVYNVTDTQQPDYHATGEAQLSAKKTFNGEAPEQGAFSFTLSNADGVIQTAANDAAGNVTFDSISYDTDDLEFTGYDEAGNRYAEFPYTIAEVVPKGSTTLLGGKAASGGMSYDATSRTVVVRVTDTGSGKLDVTYNGQTTCEVTFENEHETVDISGVKAWDDADNQDGIRPDSVTVRLLANDKDTGKTATATAKDGWTFSFTGLDAIDGKGNAISYTVEENVVDGYTASVAGSVADGFTVTNKHTPETVEIPVRKVWEDDNNRDGLRKGEITVKLLADNKEVAGVEDLKLSDATGWTDKFTDLPKYKDGKEIVYTVDEVTTVAPDYEKSVSGNAKDGFVITNKHTPETTTVSGVKDWHDNGNADGNRPGSVTVHLLADGKDTGKTAIVNAEGGWAYKFENLPVYKEGAAGQKVNYTVSEGELSDYVISVTDDGLVNTYDRETTQVRVTKSWDDGDDKDGIRPDKVSVQLLANGTVYDTAELTAATGWSYVWSELPKRLDNAEVSYTVSESTVVGYELESTTGNAADGFVITNKHVPETGDTTLTLYKTSATTGKNLVGAKFALTDADDPDKVETATTDWNGMVAFKNLHRGHAYILQETAAPGGYVLDSTQHRLAVSDEENPTVTCTDGSLEVYLDGTVGYWTWIEDQPEGDYGSFLIRKTLVGDDGVWGSVSKHPEIDTVRKNMWVSASNVDTGDWFVFQGIGNGAKGTRKVDLYDSSSNWKGQVTVTSADSMVTKVSNVPSGTWWITEYADGMTSFDGANGAKSGTSDTWTRTTTYQVNGDTTQMVGTSANDSQLKTIEITNRYRHNGGLVLKKDFGWMHTFGSVYMGNLLGEEATQTILHNIVFTLTGKNSGEVYTITGSSFNDATTAQFPSASGDSQITVSYYNRVWTITNLPYDTYTVVETSDGYRDEGQEIDTILHKFYTTGTFDVARDSNTTNVAVGNTTGTRGAEGVSETGSDVEVNSSDAEMTVMNTYYRPKVVEVTKSWSIPAGANYTPGDIEVQLVRSINGVDNNGTWQQGYFYPVTSADVPEHPGYVTRKTLHYDPATGTYDKAIFSMLPAVTANGEQITYEVREVCADGTLVPMLNGLYTDADGNVLTEGNKYVDKDGQTATATWGEGWKLKKNPYPDVDGVSRYYSSEKGLEVHNTYETTEVSGVKTWNDANDQDGIRPESVVVRLMNGDDEVDRKTVTEADNWAYSFSNLPKYLNGKEVDYAVEEVSVAGYTANVSGYDIANAHETEKTSVTATKVWDDANNQDGKRPASIHLQLIGADGAYGEPVELSDSKGWSYTWTDLPLNREGSKIDYRVVELDVPDEYEVAYAGDSAKGITVTDSYTPGVTSVSVLKEWDDGYNQDGKRPVKVSAQLYADGKATGDPVELSEDKGWSYTWTDLPLMANGEAITYTVREVAGDWASDYATEVTGDASAGFKIANTHVPETVELSGTKTWADAGNQDGKRPDSVTVRLLADNVQIDSAEVSEATGWKYEFKDLPKYQAGKVVSYKVAEDTVEGYVTTSDGANFTNTHTPEKTSVSVVKAWNDEDDYDGLRPDAVTVQLYADGEASGSAVTVNSDNDWSYTWTGLDKYAGGNEITYTVAETDGKTPAYTTSDPTWDDAEGAFVITNTHEVEKVSVHGVKTWSDNDDQDGKRPSSITVNLLANGVKVADKEVVPDSAGNWAFEFTGLDKYSGGKEIAYTVSEEEVAGYTATFGGNAADGFTIDNAYVPEKTSIKVTKTWDDANNQDGIRPSTVSVRLMNGTTTVGTAVLSAKNNWTHEWTNLDRYAGGEPIGYTVEEESVTGYTSETTGNVSSGFAITNTHAPSKVDVDVKKNWDDANNRDGKRAESVEVQLTATAAGAAVAIENTVTTVTLNAENSWRYAWSDLPEKHDGTEIEYAVTELGTPAGYTNTVTSTQKEASDGANASTSFTVANDHAPELTVVSGTKTWDDNGNQDGIRPASITVRLMNGDDEVASQEVTAATGWTYTFTNLPKYEGGHEISYSVAEDRVAGYTPAIDGTAITNKHTPETTSVSGTKAWRDGNDQDGIRPTSITVRVWNGEEEVATKTVRSGDDGRWSYEITGLPKYAAGKEISYTVTEDAIAGYTATVDGANIVNAHTPETTSVSGKKVWADNDDQDGKRPTSVTVNLLADGEKVDSKTVTAADGWSYSFTDLAKFRDHGTEIAYTVTEDAVSGYTTAIEGGTITNTHVPETTSVSGKKVWADNDDQDGKRPASVTVNLLANGTKVDSKAVGPDANGNWNYSFTDLPKYEDGEEIAYTVTEERVADYTTAINGTTITNTHTPETMSVSGKKSWSDNNDQDGIRPSAVTVHLLADGEVVRTAVATEEGGWAYSFADLPKCKGGAEIGYTVSEEEVVGYTASIDGFNIANAHTPEKTSLTGEKVWSDGNDQDGIRPDEVTVRVWNGATEVASTKATAENNWAYEFTGLDKYANGGQPISYTVTEDRVEGYEAAISGTTITNTHVPETIDVSGTKTWADAGDQDGIRPESVTVHLLANGHEVQSTPVTPDSNGNWTYSFTGLPKFEAGDEIAYTVTEDAVDGYETSIEGTAITNTHTPETTSVEGVKSWNDNDDQDGARPDEITVRLLADGVEAASTTATAEGNWSYKFENLPVYKAGSVGTEVVYTVVEDAVDGYQATYDGFDIANAHTPDKTSVSGVKTWDDANDQDGVRPESITVRLLANGTEVDSATVTADDDWKYAFTDLDKYANGTEIAYTVTEDAVPNYTTQANGYNFTNTHAPETIELSGTKTWNDNDDQDGLRPESITVRLLANGTEVAHATATAEGGWAYRFTGLPRFANGKEITYTVAEDEVAGYTASVSGMNVTNTHVPEKTSVSGAKIWDDNNDQDGARPSEVTVRLLANGTEVDSVTVKPSAEGAWSYAFTGLDKYAGGQLINYTVAEDAVEGYTAQVSGYTITNAHVPEKTSVSGAKTWNDANDQDGIRPSKITVHLLANGEEVKSATVTPNGEGSWTYRFDELDKYANGSEITYTVTEDAVEGYQVAYDGMNITNTRTPNKTNVTGVKSWSDANDQDGKRPESVTVRLYANGEEVDSATITAADNWTYEFADLPENSNGEKIVYTVSEDEVAEYATEVSGYNVKNSYTPETVDLSGTKTWDDGDDQDGIRPTSVTVHLLADGEQVRVATVTPDEEGVWSYVFKDMPKYAAGKEISYTVTEDAVDGYTSSIDGFNIANTHVPDTTEVSGTKTWADAGNQDGARPGKVTVRLLADGTEVASADVTEASGWSYKFDNLPKNKAGHEISYAVAEDAVDNYQAAYAGTAITNTHTPDKTSVSGVKTWDDANDQDGVRPASITVNLLANGTKVDSKTVTAADGWAYTFADLDKYANGSEIVYTITEDAVPGYTSAVEGYNVKNTHAPETVDLSGKKTWNDSDDQDGKRPSSVTVHLLANGTEVAHAEVTADDNWSYAFTGMAKYASGSPITYTVTESPVEGYAASTSGLDITNTHVPETTSVSGAKTWNDANNQDGKRPSSVTVNLLADGVKADSKTVTANDSWTYQFVDLPVYKAGKKIVYTVSEEPVTEYATTIDGFNIANAHVPETIDLSGKKTWSDADDQDGIRPESVTVHLWNGEAEVASKTVTAADDWAYEFKNLPKYAGGTEIAYTLTEDEVAGYESEVSGLNVANAHTPETTSVEGAKVWDDADDQDGKRPDTVTVRLLADGDEVAVTTATKDGGWTYKFDNLPKYKAGAEISYTVTEDEVANYTTSIAGTTITNSHVPEKTSVTGAKVWDDAGNQDGKRPGSITVRLLADGVEIDARTITPDANGAWPAFTFDDLPAYANGERIEYTLAEDAVAGYEAAEIDFPAGTGAVIKNKYVPETTEVSGAKTWDDNGNQDGKRPSSITVRLLAGGSEVQSKTVTAADNWSYTFASLPKYSAGTEISYAVAEDAVTGYEAAVDGYDIVNAHAPEKMSVKVEKVWNDENDYDGLRPASIQVQLYANGQPAGEAATLSQASGWAHTWSDLDKYASGAEIAYTVAEVNAAAAAPAYTASAPTYDADRGVFVITNAHTPEKVAVKGTKTWSDANNQDGKRPDSIRVDLLANGSKVQSKTVTAADGWAFEFSNLDKYSGGKEIAYTVAEEQVEGYTATITGTAAAGFAIDNAYTPEKTKVKVSKVWDDGDDFDGVRPGSVSVRLTNGVDTIETAELNDDNNWSYEWTDLDRYADGVEIPYTVVEDAVPNYSAELTGSITSGFTLKNTHAPTLVDVKADKAWDDADNQDGKRAGSVEVRLNATVDGAPVALDGVTMDATLSEANDWHHEWLNLPQMRGGKVVTYTLSEVGSIEGYDSVVRTDQAAATETADSVISFAVTNDHAPELIDIPASKIWDDADDQDGMRPESIIVQLYAGDDPALVNGAPVTATLNADNGWEHTFEYLPKYAAGTEIAYHVVETAVPDGYTATVGEFGNGYTVTNEHAPDTSVEIAADKTWDDSNNQDGMRPGSAKVQLYANGAAVGEPVELSAANDWHAAWTGLPKKSSGSVISYTVGEVDVPEGYTLDVSGSMSEGFDLVNAHTPEVTSAQVTKVWDDADDQDGKRPESVTVQLLANDGAYGEPVTLSAANGWHYAWADLPLKQDGEVVSYNVVESSVPDDYTATVSGDRESGFVITNSYTPGVTNVTVSKAWDDAGNQDGIRPDAVKVRLLADGAQVEAEGVASEVELNEGNHWAYTWEGLDQMKAGKAIAYTVEEVDVPEGYRATTAGSADEGFVITNVHAPELTQVEASKTWADDDNRDGIRPTGVALTLHANGESVATQSVVADARGNWTYTFENLPKYAAGAEIAYTITEAPVDGYTASIDGFAATNTHDNETVEVSGVKTWNDNNNQDGRRARAIAVNLLADGKVVDSKTVSEADGWKYSFTGLNKYRDGGIEIAYTITEDAVEGYDASVDGYNLTNTLQVGTLTVAKTVQNATKSGKPFKFTVTLDDPRVQGQHGGMNFVDGIATFELANGESIEAIDLPVGVRYAVTEDDVVGYLATSQGATGTISANANATAHYTNIYNASADVEFFAMKNLVGRTLNAEEFTFELLENGRVIQTAKNAGDGHARFDAITYTIEDLGTHEYQIREAAGNVNGVEYDTTKHDFSVNVSDNGDGTLEVEYVGYNPETGVSFTNTYTPSGKVAPTTRKSLDGAAPAAGAYEFQLADASGRVVATATNASDGTVTFPELTFKAAGTYEYTISEVVPDGAQKLGDRLVYDGVFYDRGESTVTIEAIDNFDGTLRFTTTYDSGTPKTFENETAPEVTFPLEATKAISGRDFRAGDEFTFTVDGSDGAPSPARASATIRPTSGTEAKVSFGDITFTTADLGNTYTYTVHEAGAGETVGGVTNDPFAHVVTLTVVDAGDGTMGVVAEYENDADGLVFTNTYRASGEAVLTATKTLSGRALADNEFFFELSGDNLPGTLHANAAADGSIEFAPIAFTQDDAGRDFHYTMREVQGTLGGITYDTHEYEITLHVTDNGDGTLAVAYDYGASGAAPVFENAYRTENVSVQLGAHKALVGGTLEAGAFTFELRGVSDNAAGTNLSVGNDADGTVSFGAIEYSEPGTYEYRISEAVPDGATDNGDGTFTGADGIIYDGSEHTAVVTVVDDGYGKLVADVDYDGGATGVSFGNVALVRTGFAFDKHYFGNVGSFDFTLTATDENGSPRAGASTDYSDAATIVDDGSQAFTATVQNGAFTDGVAKVVFPEIGYVADGDYYYLIAEAEGDAAEMVADKAQYLAHVTVRGGEVAGTTFELIYEGENLGATDDLSFYNNAMVTLGFNSLKAQGYTSFGERVSVYPKAKKYLNDSTDQLVGGEFTFELIDEATGSVLAVATNDEQGNVAFFDENTDPGLAYDEAGTFRYIMREVAGNESDMVYDTSSILLTVDVADTDDGLVATTTYNGPGGGEPAFYNVKRGMDVTVQKVSRYGGEGLADCTYALWMVGEDGDALIGEATSDAQGYITFKDVTLLAGQKYYFKEVEAPKGHTVDPYRTAYFSLNEAGDALVLVEKTSADGWHSATEK